MTQQNAVRIPQAKERERAGFNREKEKIWLYLCHGLVLVINQIWEYRATLWDLFYFFLVQYMGEYML